MVSWIKTRPPLDVQRDKFQARLRDVRAGLDDILAAKKRHALAAATGDANARSAFLELERQAEAQRTEADVLASAIEAVEQQKAKEKREVHARLQAQAAEQRARVLDARE